MYMKRMVRKQLYFDAELDRELKRRARARRMSEAQMVRELLKNSLADELPVKQAEAWKQTRRFIEEVLARGPVPGGRTWRREDLYERKGLSRH